MNKFRLKFSLLGLLAIAVAGIPVELHAQNAPAAPTTEKKLSRRVLPFHGKLKAIDNTAKTISVGELTLQITSETKITKGATPATLEDGTAGDEVAGAYRKDEEGKLNVVSLRFAPKPVTTENAKTNTPSK